MLLRRLHLHEQIDGSFGYYSELALIQFLIPREDGDVRQREELCRGIEHVQEPGSRVNMHKTHHLILIGTNNDFFGSFLDIAGCI